MTATEVQISKFLSFALRHDPKAAGIELDSAGWVPVEEMIQACVRQGYQITRIELETVVENNSKQRFAFNEDKTKIRASQGHSISVELGLTAQAPPPVLYHGTATRFIESIRSTGLEKRDRQHVHLSADLQTAVAVGERHGKPTVLRIQAQRMQENGHHFFLSANGVWLADHVPTEFIEFPEV